MQHRQIADELPQGFARLFENTAFILGEEVASFEREFAQFSGVKHCVGVANGTDALEMMLRAVGVGDRDEVIVPANSFFATAFAVMRARHPFQQGLYLPVCSPSEDKDRGYGNRNDTGQL